MKYSKTSIGPMSDFPKIENSINSAVIDISRQKKTNYLKERHANQILTPEIH